LITEPQVASNITVNGITALESVPEIIDPVFTKTSPTRSFCMTENERFGLVLTKTGFINAGTDYFAKQLRLMLTL
jgi:hypothetical protein